MKPEFARYSDGLLPAVVQDAQTLQVLMLGYMNEVSWQQTLETRFVTFYSRSRQELWVKGATSGNTLLLQEWHLDCDNDSLLLLVDPAGPVCHTGSTSCFSTSAVQRHFLDQLEQTIAARRNAPAEDSYTASLFASGPARMAQKVGEEAVELVIEALQERGDRFIGEAADLVFHLLVLLQAKGFRLKDVVQELAGRSRNR